VEKRSKAEAQRHRIDRPSQIAEAQRLLTRWSNTGGTNGKMGPRTQEMVRAFQWTTGLPLSGATDHGPAGNPRHNTSGRGEGQEPVHIGRGSTQRQAAWRRDPLRGSPEAGAQRCGRIAGAGRSAARTQRPRGRGAPMGNSQAAVARCGASRASVSLACPMQQPPNAQTTNDAASQAAHPRPGSSRPTAPAA
jgi:peptidoglycan hydrolase-like protein with peptidoglycan-binding domain